MKKLRNEVGMWLAVATVATALAGCGHKAPAAKVTAEQLQRSYEKADAATRQDVAQAGAALQAGNYTQAIVTMQRVVQAQPVDATQKQAVAVLIQQTREAVRQNPQLNTPELYKAMANLVHQVHGEN